MRRLILSIVVLSFVTIGVVGAVPSIAASRVGPATNGRWTLAHWTRPAGKGSLWGISATSPIDIWAVGGLYGVGAMVERWNGERWERVAAPRYRQFGAVAVFSPTNVWAVGGHSTGCTTHPVIDHWNGRRWSASATVPELGPGLGNLASISAVSASDIWAVGSFSPDASLCGGFVPAKDVHRTRPLIMHLDGDQWVAAEAGPEGMGASFVSVVAFSPTNVWAAGNESIRDNGHRTLIEHWNGRNWSVVPSAHPGPRGRGFLLGVSATGPRDIWAVGYYAASQTRQHTFTERWNGSAWRQIPSPNLACHLNDFTSVSMLSRTDGWAVGGAAYCGNPTERSETAHWNGVRWSLVPSQNTKPNGTYLEGVVSVSHNAAWAVGASEGREDGGAGRGVIERYRQHLTARRRLSERPVPLSRRWKKR
jgi:hypothetical protein